MYQANREGVEDPLESGADEMDPSIYCLPDGMPRVYLVNYPLEIVQVPGRMYMLFENTHLVRRIYMDGRKMPEDYPPSFMGYSTGRWEEDTLVVETVGLDDLSWLDRVGTPHSDALRIVERIRRVDHDTLEIDFLFEDPNAFTKSLEGKRVFQLQSDWKSWNTTVSARIVSAMTIRKSRFSEQINGSSLANTSSNHSLQMGP